MLPIQDSPDCSPQSQPRKESGLQPASSPALRVGCWGEGDCRFRHREYFATPAGAAILPTALIPSPNRPNAIPTTRALAANLRRKRALNEYFQATTNNLRQSRTGFSATTMRPIQTLLRRYKAQAVGVEPREFRQRTYGKMRRPCKGSLPARKSIRLTAL